MTIGKHVNNAPKEELAGISVVANFATTTTDSTILNTVFADILSDRFEYLSQNGRSEYYTERECRQIYPLCKNTRISFI